MLDDFGQLKDCKRLQTDSQHLNISPLHRGQRGEDIPMPAACLRLKLRHSNVSVLDLKVERMM